MVHCNRSQPGAVALTFARLSEGWHETDLGGEHVTALELGWVADFGYDSRSGLGADAIDVGQECSDIVVAEVPLDVPVEVTNKAPLQDLVLAVMYFFS
jgi:hypothetical protein